MQGLINAIRAALSAMRTMVWKVVKIGGRAVLMLVPGPRNDPQGAIAGGGPAAVEGYDLDAVREAAGLLAQGLEVPTDRTLTGTHGRWLQSLTRLQLCRVMCASDASLRGHLDGRIRIDKLPPSAAVRPAARRLDYKRRLAAYQQLDMQRTAAAPAVGMQPL